MSKYKITYTDLTSQGGVEKLERDGFSRSEVIKEVYRHTDSLPNHERADIVSKLYDRMSTDKGYKDVKDYKERWGR